MEPAARIAVPRKCLETGAVYLARRIQGIGTVALPRSLVLLGRSNSPGEASSVHFPCWFAALSIRPSGCDTAAKSNTPWSQSSTTGEAHPRILDTGARPASAQNDVCCCAPLSKVLQHAAS